ncbi:hypothetical protein AGR7A_Cc120280 [Agrobacterium deltaense NCPPB 1641]|uniref:Uncharacterized protein n=1 Tax=Agrobacterium deltaense NCPPB 1641 TaxID=1183425 RepID=A0A1S7TKH9_9HYPH|nr:hypothetical protein AGR7A_Cc120280 [Agrobacterium deltaense NCPPB 1641]
MRRVTHPTTPPTTATWLLPARGRSAAHPIDSAEARAASPARAVADKIKFTLNSTDLNLLPGQPFEGVPTGKTRCSGIWKSLSRSDLI